MRSATIVLLSAAALALSLLPASTLRAEGEFPAGLARFSGQVRGNVVAKEGDGFTFKVARLLNVWKGSTAASPESIVGRTIRVGPRMETNEGVAIPMALHVSFIVKIEAGLETSLEVRHAGGDRFELLELTKARAAHQAAKRGRARLPRRQDQCGRVGRWPGLRACAAKIVR